MGGDKQGQRSIRKTSKFWFFGSETMFDPLPFCHGTYLSSLTLFEQSAPTRYYIYEKWYLSDRSWLNHRGPNIKIHMDA